MTFINLRDFYPWYVEDQIVQVSNEVYEELVAGRRSEVSYQRRALRHKAHYSLDADDGLDCAVYLGDPTPQELLERKELFYQLWNALNSLPEIQGRRVDACVILGMSYRAVARAEGVDKSTVRESVAKGLENMRKYLKNFR